MGIVAKVWYLIRMFRLSLGTRDQVAAVIAAMPEINDAVIPPAPPAWHNLGSDD